VTTGSWSEGECSVRCSDIQAYKPVRQDRKSKERSEAKLTREENQGALCARTLSFKNSKRAGAVVAERLLISSIL